jgi:hypothetical protein
MDLNNKSSKEIEHIVENFLSDKSCREIASMGKDLDKMTGREIVCLVENITGEFITIPLKNKKSIVAKAKKIFESRGISLNNLTIESEITSTKKEPLSSQPKQTYYIPADPRIRSHKAKEIKAVIREYEELTKKNLVSFRQALLEINDIH